MRRPARAEVVGSLLKPPALRELRSRESSNPQDHARLAALEDEAVLSAIELQESVGLDVITDGEMRRSGWADTVMHLEGFAPREGQRSYPNSARRAMPSGPMLTVVERIAPRADAPLGSEYRFLREHASARTKFTMAAPSYHRRYWLDDQPPEGYASCEEYLEDIRDWQREVARWLASQGCDYLQLDAPNYGSLCDPITRSFHEERGHPLREQVAFDAALDSSVFDGLDGVTRALHICRGNMAGAAWHSSGGYQAIADDLFPHLSVDVVLLEYDSDRAGDLAPVGQVNPGTVVVLGLLTTKSATLEDEELVRARIDEACGYRPRAELALSTQCGFSSQDNAPMSEAEERSKLALVSRIAHDVWRSD